MGIKPTTISMFNMSQNPAYQINYSNEAIGKTLASSKRKVQWKFGISDEKSIGMGKTGSECRGDEHEVTMIWSITSCKCNIMYDKKEVYVMISKRMEMSIEASWAIEGTCHIMKVVAHAVKPFSAEGAKFRRFDLQLDGMSFFDMPKIYELGLKKVSHHPRSDLPMKGTEKRPTIKRTNEFTDDDLDQVPADKFPSICDEDNRKMIVRKDCTISQTRSANVDIKKAPAIVDLLDFSYPPTMSPPADNRIPTYSSYTTNAVPSHLDQNLAANQLALMNAPSGPNFAIPPLHDYARNDPSGMAMTTSNEFSSFSRYTRQQPLPDTLTKYCIPQGRERQRAHNPVLSNTLVLYDHQRSYNCGQAYEPVNNTLQPIHSSDIGGQLNWY